MLSGISFNDEYPAGQIRPANVFYPVIGAYQSTENWSENSNLVIENIYQLIGHIHVILSIILPSNFSRVLGKSNDRCTNQRMGGPPLCPLGHSNGQRKVSEFYVFTIFLNPEFCAEIGQIACVVPENVCGMMCNGIQECLEPMEEANCSE